MCYTGRRVLIQVERERLEREFQARLQRRIEHQAYNPPDEYIWEEIWAKQVPYMRDQAEAVYSLFTPDKSLCENDFSFYEDESRFYHAHNTAAKELALYLVSPHEDCPLTWPVQKWVFFIRKLFNKALRDMPRPEFVPPRPPTPPSPSSSLTLSSEIPSDDSEVISISDELTDSDESSESDDSIGSAESDWGLDVLVTSDDDLSVLSFHSAPF